MTVQDALLYAGILSCVVAVGLALLTAYSFVSQDIPAVLDDLSGKRRMRDLASLADMPSVLDAPMLKTSGFVAEVQEPPVQEVQTVVAGYHQAEPTVVVLPTQLAQGVKKAGGEL